MAETLYDVTYTGPQIQQILDRVYNMPSGTLATQTWVSNQGYLTSSALSDYATQSWVTQRGYITSSALTEYATQEWVGTQLDSYLPLSGGTLTGQLTSTVATGTAPISVASTTACTNLNADLLDGFHAIDLFSHITSGTLYNLSITIGGTQRRVSELYATKTVQLLNARSLWGNSFDGTAGIGTASNDRASLSYVSNIEMTGTLRIGDGVLTWDSENNAIKVMKHDGTAANFYALGGVSALGQSSGSGGGAALTEPLATINDAGLGAPSGSNKVLLYNGSRWTYANLTSGSVTSVGLSMPTGFSVSSSPVTSSGTLAVTFGGSVTANTVLASPNGSAGAPSWRSLVTADIPSLDTSKITSGTFTTARIPNLSASKITSGTFDLARIPNLSASKITDGTFDLARIPDNFMQKYNHDTSVDIDTLYTAGSHRFGATADGTWPTGVTANYGQMLVVRGSGDTLAQLFFPYGAPRAYLRCGNPINTSGSWREWKTLANTDDTVSAANYLKDTNGNNRSATLFGVSYFTDGVPVSAGYDGHPASLNYVDSITMYGNLSGASILELNTLNPISNYGGVIDFHYYSSSVDYTRLDWSTRIVEKSPGILTISALDTSGAEKVAGLVIGNSASKSHYLQVGSPATTNASYVQIGNVRLTYDSTNNALRLSSPSGGAANFYATGGVSALGLSGGSGSATVSNLNVSSGILFTDEDCWLQSDGFDLKIGSIDSDYTLLMGDMASILGSNEWYINCDGSAKFASVTTPTIWMSGSVRLYYSSGHLYFYNGSSTITLA